MTLYSLCVMELLNSKEWEKIEKKYQFTQLHNEIPEKGFFFEREVEVCNLSIKLKYILKLVKVEMERWLLDVKHMFQKVDLPVETVEKVEVLFLKQQHLYQRY